MKQSTLLWVMVAAFVTAGCLGSEGEADPAEVGAESAASEEGGEAQESDGGSEEDAEALSSECVQPEGSTGTSNGDVMNLDLAVKLCDGTTTTLLDLACGAEAVLVDISAEWCEACKIDAEHLEEVYLDFKDKGLVMITVLTEAQNNTPATNAVCDAWTTEFGLTSYVVTDPTGQTGSLVEGDPSSTLPVDLILDADFVIQSKTTGGLSKGDLVEKLEDVLGD